MLPLSRHNYQAPDHISDLPEAILVHILSFMPTRDALKTSILSKSWEHIWTQLNVMDFSGMPHDFPHLQFMCFVDKVLCYCELPGSNLQLLRFDFTGQNEDGYLMTLLEIIVTYEIREIEVVLEDSANPPKPVALPTRMLFSCKGLVVLKLNGMFSVFPIHFHSPCLETLHLISVELRRCTTDAFMKVLSSACPMLKDLVIRRCRCKEYTLYVEFSTLEALEVKSTLGKYNKNTTCLVIKTPNLRSLHLADTVKQCDICELSFLVEAHLDVCIVDSKHAREFARIISGVKSLVWLGRSLLRPNSSMPPIFLNLTYLKIDADGGAYEALQSAPNLKTLVFRKLTYWDYKFESKSELKCLSCLENVEFSYFKGDAVERSFVAYFLKVAVVLKEMKISTSLTYSSMHERLML